MNRERPSNLFPDRTSRKSLPPQRGQGLHDGRSERNLTFPNKWELPKGGSPQTLLQEVTIIFLPPGAIPPSEKDKQLANSLTPTLETRTAELVGGQQGHIKVLPLALGGTVLVVGAGAGGFFIHDVLAENVPIGSFPNSFNDTRLQDLPPNIEQPSKPNKDTVFDNTATSGVYRNGNIVGKDQAGIDALPNEDETGNPIYLFPLVLDEKDSIKYKKQGVNKNGEILYGALVLDKVKAGTSIVAPHDGYAFISISSHNGGEPRVSNVRVVFEAENGDVYVIVLQNSHMSTSLLGLQTVDDSIPSTDQVKHFRDFRKGKPVKRGDLLAQSVQDLSNVDIQIARFIYGNFDDLKLRTTDSINFLSQDDKLVVKKSGIK